MRTHSYRKWRSPQESVVSEVSVLHHHQSNRAPVAVPVSDLFTLPSLPFTLEATSSHQPWDVADNDRKRLVVVWVELLLLLTWLSGFTSIKYEIFVKKSVIRNREAFNQNSRGRVQQKRP